MSPDASLRHRAVNPAREKSAYLTSSQPPPRAERFPRSARRTSFLEPNLTAGLFYEGIFNMVDFMGGEIIERYDPATAPHKPQPWKFDWVMFCGVMILLSVIGSVTGVRMGIGNPGMFMRRGGFGGGRSGGGGARGRF